MVTTLTGSNTYALQLEINKLIHDFIAEYSDFGLERLDGEEVTYNRIEEALQSLPFLATRKLIVLRTPSANKTFVERAEAVIVKVPDSTDIIIIEPKIDKRMAYYKILKSKTTFIEFRELDEMQLTQWLVNTVNDNEGTLSKSDAEYLLERVGTNQLILNNELQKLLIYRSHITRETIDRLTEQIPQGSVFDLLDATFGGNAKRAVLLYDSQRKQKIEPQEILSMIVWQVRVLVIVLLADDKQSQQIAAEAKINPFVVRKSQAIARKLSLPYLKQVVRDLLAIDIVLKTKTIDPDEVLVNFIMSLAE